MLIPTQASYNLYLLLSGKYPFPAIYYTPPLYPWPCISFLFDIEYKNIYIF